MDLSIDMLSVGNADALIIWIKEGETSLVFLIDGGNKTDSDSIINHLENYIFPNTKQKTPDFIICTHPDKDHIGGLFKVIEHYKNIGTIFLHDPAKHMGNNYSLLKESARRKVASKGFDYIFESLEMRDELVELVSKKNIPIIEPFYNKTKLNNTFIKVLGPSEEFYTSLLPDFRNIDKFLEKEAAIISKMWEAQYSNVLESIEKSVYGDDPCPIVDANNDTSAENNSSVVLEISVAEKRFLFTADAGVQALLDIHLRGPLNNIFWLDVPHHGSRRNLSSKLIKILSPQMAFVSAIGSTKHPRKALVNCLKKTGTTVYSTHNNGNMWYHTNNFPDRSNYKPLTPL